MKTRNLILSAILLLSFGCDNNDDLSKSDNENVNISSIKGKWKIIEENDAWDNFIHPVDYYRVWEFFLDGTVKHYYDSNNIDNHLKMYELKSDSLYIYYDNIKEECCTHVYSCRFIDEEKNKIRIEYLQGNRTDIKQPSLWIFERVNQDISLADTQWKLSGIFDVQNNSLKVLNPVDCEDCYTLTFDTDSTATGKSSTNLVWVDLSSQRPIGIPTMIGERGDGYLFYNAIGLVTSYSCNENELKFFYKENGKEYFLLYVRNSSTPINITLYDKSPDIIQHYIQGKWQLIYGKGGIMANMIQPYDNHFVEFTSDGKHIYTSPYENDTATIQKWDRVAGNTIYYSHSYSGVDYTYIMIAEPHRPLFMGEIKNDTLIYYEYYASDPMLYHCVKINNLKK